MSTTTKNTNETASGALEDMDNIVNDIARLDTLLSQPELSESDDADLAELFKRLDSAGDMAEDLDIKLDGILAKLNGILDSIAVDVDQEGKVGNAVAGEDDDANTAAAKVETNDTR